VLARRFRVPGQQLKGLKGRTMARSLYFIAKATRNTLSYSRFAVVVGKNVHSGSVYRHSVKRRIVASLLNQNFGGCDIVIIVLVNAKKLSLKELSGEFRNFLATLPTFS
jgi:ribonuclease P protein component